MHEIKLKSKRENRKKMKTTKIANYPELRVHYGVLHLVRTAALHQLNNEVALCGQVDNGIGANYLLSMEIDRHLHIFSLKRKYKDGITNTTINLKISRKETVAYGL